MGTSTRSLQQTVYRHLKEFLTIAIYLWVVFGLLVMFKSVVLAEHHIPLAYHGFALINALALAKVMFVAKKLHLGDRFDEAPLIYPTFFKSAVFTAVLACFKILEEIPLASITVNPSTRVLPSLAAPGKQFQFSHCYCSRFSSLSSVTANCKEFLARGNWGRSFSAHRRHCLINRSCIER